MIFPIPYLHINSNFVAIGFVRGGCGRNGMKMKGDVNLMMRVDLVFENAIRYIQINKNLKSKYNWGGSVEFSNCVADESENFL